MYAYVTYSTCVHMGVGVGVGVRVCVCECVISLCIMSFCEMYLSQRKEWEV